MPSSPFPGIAVALLGAGATLLASNGLMGTFSCGTWSLDCGFTMVVVTFLTQSCACVMLVAAARNAAPRSGMRWLAIVFALASGLAALAAGGVLAFLALALMQRGIL